jgi:hypothetical protein
MIDDILSFIILVSAGLIYRAVLQFSGHEWVKTYNQTFTFMVLPFITFIITRIIEGNIALSLGMIGALSIVRFRHPVKSALELVMYFNLITVGIATSADIEKGILLILGTVFLILLLKICEIIFKKFNLKIFTSSFSDGNELNIIELKSKERKPILEEHPNLKNFNFSDETSDFFYRLVFDNSENLKNFRKKIINDKTITIVNFEII